MAVKNKTEELKGWQNVTGKARVFANEKEYKKNGKKQIFRAFTTSLSIKDDDEWINYYVNVVFKKDEAPAEDMVDINILSGFLTFDATDKGKYLKLVVTDYEII